MKKRKDIEDVNNIHEFVYINVGQEVYSPYIAEWYWSL